MFFNPFEYVKDHNDFTDPDSFVSSEVRDRLLHCDCLNIERFFEHSFFKDRENFLRILFFNCRSLPKHFDEFLLELRLEESKCDFICAAKTWLVLETEQLFDISGYNSFFCSRSNRGVAIYVRNTLNKVAKINDISWVCESFECIFLKIEIENIVFIGGSIYRPPNSNADVFRIKLNDVLNYVDNNFPQCILIINGNFNLNLFKCGVDRSCTDYYSLILCHNLYPLILKHTRINSQSATLIDNIFCNNINILCHSGIVTVDFSDHFAIFASFKMNNHVDNSAYTEVKRRGRDKKEKNLRMLRYSLREASWADIKNIHSFY